MTYHFYFKNNEPVYETEYMQSLKQFAVYFPHTCTGYVLNKTSKALCLLEKYSPCLLSVAAAKYCGGCLLIGDSASSLFLFLMFGLIKLNTEMGTPPAH